MKNITIKASCILGLLALGVQNSHAAEAPLLTYNEESAAPDPVQSAGLTPATLDEIAQAIYGKSYLEVIEIAKTDPENAIFKRVGDLSQDLEESFGQYKTQYIVSKIVEGGLAEKCNGAIGDEITGLIILSNDTLNQNLNPKPILVRIFPALTSINIEKLLNGKNKTEAKQLFERAINDYFQRPFLRDGFPDVSAIGAISQNAFYNFVISPNAATGAQTEQARPDQSQLVKSYQDFLSDLYHEIKPDYSAAFASSLREAPLNEMTYQKNANAFAFSFQRNSPRSFYICGYTTPSGKRLINPSSSNTTTDKFASLPRSMKSAGNPYGIFRDFKGPDLLEDTLGVKVNVVATVKTGLKQSELAPANTMLTIIPPTSLPQRVINSIDNARGEKYASNRQSVWLTELIDNVKNDGFNKDLRVIRKHENGSAFWAVTSEDKLIFSLITPIYSKYAEDITPVDFLINKNTENLVSTYLDGFVDKRGSGHYNKLAPCLYDDGLAWHNDSAIFKSDGSTINLAGRDAEKITSSLRKKYFQFIQEKFVPKLAIAQDTQLNFSDSNSLLSPTGDYLNTTVNFNRQDVNGYTVITRDDDGYLITYAFPTSLFDRKVAQTQALLKARAEAEGEAREKIESQIRQVNRAYLIHELREKGYLP